MQSEPHLSHTSSALEGDSEVRSNHLNRRSVQYIRAGKATRNCTVCSTWAFNVSFMESRYCFMETTLECDIQTETYGTLLDISYYIQQGSMLFEKCKR